MVATLVRYKNSTIIVYFYLSDSAKTCYVSFFEQMDDNQYNSLKSIHPYAQFKKIELDDRYPYLTFSKLNIFPSDIRQKIIKCLNIRDIYRNHIIDGII